MASTSGIRFAIAVLVGSAIVSPALAQEAGPPADRAQWTAAIRQAFSANKPDLAAIRGVSGSLRPELSIVIQPDGSVSDVTVKRSSGFKPADDAAIAMIRSAGRLPAFTPDMPKDKLSFNLPVGLSFTPTEEQDLRLYIDTANGLRLEVREPLVIRASPADPRFDAVAQVEAGESPPPYAAAGEPLCLVGFKKAAASEAAADPQARVDAAKDEIVAQSTAKGLEPETTDVTDYRATKLIELTLKPKPGTETPDRRYYTAAFELPEGAVTLFCGTEEKTMSAALDAFRSIRDGASAAPR